VSVRCGGGTGGMSVVHRSGKNDRRAPLLRRSAKGRRGGFPPLVNGGPFSLCRCPFPARGASACFASSIEWPVVLDSAMEVAIQCSMFYVLAEAELPRITLSLGFDSGKALATQRSSSHVWTERRGQARRVFVRLGRRSAAARARPPSRRDRNSPARHARRQPIEIL